MSVVLCGKSAGVEEGGLMQPSPGFDCHAECMTLV